MFDVLRELHRKLDEVVGRQERTLSLVSQGGGGQVPPAQLGQPAQQQVPPAGGFVDTIRRHEVDAVFNNHNQILAASKEIRQFILELKTRSDTIINNQARAPTAQVQSVGYDTQSLVSEMRDGLNHVKQHYGQVMQKLNEKPSCPSGSGVSVTLFLVTIVVHLAIILGYNIYRDSKESQAKKFY